MKTVFASVCVCLVAGNLLAQNYYRAEQQAKRDSALNDAEQQRIQREAGGSGGGSGAAAPAPTDPALQATLKNVSDLQVDFAAVINSTADKPDPSQKVSLLNDLTHAAQGTKATSDSVKKLADDLLSAVAGKKSLAAAQQTKLAREVHALFNSAHLTPAQQQTVLADVQKILTDAGVSADAAGNVVTDLKAVVADTK